MEPNSGKRWVDAESAKIGEMLELVRFDDECPQKETRGDDQKKRTKILQRSLPGLRPDRQINTERQMY